MNAIEKKSDQRLPTVDVIMVSYNPEPWFDYVIKCINNEPFRKVYWIDNASDAQSELGERLQDIVHPLEYLPQTTNLGFGKANNLGLRKAYDQGADYVLLLNQDAWFEPGTLQRLIEIPERDPQWGVLAPIQVTRGANALDDAFRFHIAPQSNPFIIDDAILRKGALEDVYEVPFLNAACWLLPRHTLKKVGAFNPLFFHYGEDDNYCQRVRYKGLKVGLVTGAQFTHDRGNRTKPDIEFGSEKYFAGLWTRLAKRWADPNHAHWKKSFRAFQRREIAWVAYCLLSGRLSKAKIHVKSVLFGLQLQKDIRQVRSHQIGESAYL